MESSMALRVSRARSCEDRELCLDSLTSDECSTSVIAVLHVQRRRELVAVNYCRFLKWGASFWKRFRGDWWFLAMGCMLAVSASTGDKNLVDQPPASHVVNLTDTTAHFPRATSTLESDTHTSPAIRCTTAHNCLFLQPLYPP